MDLCKLIEGYEVTGFNNKTSTLITGIANKSVVAGAIYINGLMILDLNIKNVPICNTKLFKLIYPKMHGKINE